jgi:hypothetical protein
MAIVNYIPPAREVPAGKMVFEQVDLFLGDGETRSPGVLVAGLQVAVHAGPTVLSWPIVTGVSIPDVRVSAGKVYWAEFAAGFYSIRFFPHIVGLWRVILTYPAHNQVLSYTYNVVTKNNSSPGVGFKASFTR